MKKIWVIAGEVSGDHHASTVMEAILGQDPNVIFQGAGGPKMERLSTQPFDNWVEKASVTGLWDVLKIYPWFRKKFFEMLQRINNAQPHALLLVDYPGFNLRLARTARSRFPGLKILYYISPQVWAWNRRRMTKMAKLLDLVLCIFPFEKELYESSGLASRFVGHPLVEKLEGEHLCARRDSDLLALLPGSRWEEVHRIFPIMLRTASLLLKRRSCIQFEVAAANENHAKWMRNGAREAQIPMCICTGTAYSLMQRACAGIVCSGTATLESAYFELPYCLIYKTAWVTFWMGCCVATVPFLGIVNILAGELVVREFVQHSAKPEAIAHECLRLLYSHPDRRQLVAKFRAVVTTLSGSGAAMRAAKAILAAVS
ncbi:lipid-A-disaccharide synthase [Candidatus Xiphinematobacter sp. Idaho Grape]|uniref:lipid-A-disaccharide synthase n=1 Tax=Candidatus Xiphinematobacter sp. Idaho Grape TaxID=1704307 RepID=UPI0007831735|nr:lipid-A-disaccharide synthase [Candidatus Xiphinematobacter sp. Idaho Grape]